MTPDDRLGVSNPFVLKIRAELVKVGKIEAPKAVVGKDGKEQASSKPEVVTVTTSDQSPPENPGIFDDVDERSESAEPVNESDDGR